MNKDNNVTIIEQQAEQIRALREQVVAMRSNDVFVGVRNNTKGDQYISVLGGDKKTGEDDIIIGPGDAAPVPARTWEYMLGKGAISILNGNLSRDDSVLGAFGKMAAPDFGEAERAPNALTADRIKELFGMKVPDFRRAIDGIDAIEAVERLISAAEEMEDIPYKHVEALRARGAGLISIVPKDASVAPIEELVRLGYEYGIPRFAPENYGKDIASLRAFIIENLQSIESKMRRTFLGKKEE